VSQSLGFVLRFLIGGLLVALAPVVAQKLSPALGGMVLLFPAITIGGLTGIWIGEGDNSVEKAAIGALVGVPAVLAYLIGITISLRRGMDYPYAAMFGVVLWIVVAGSLSRLAGLWR
jgi:uncharacterized membrane protein (GlpM family)